MNGTVRGLLIAGISAGALVAAAGCGGIEPSHPTAAALNAATHATSPPPQQTHASPPTGEPVAPSPAASPSDGPAAQAPVPSAVPADGYQGPHFTSPESAMTYLAAAYNSSDAAALHAVTTPSSYLELMQMRSEAVNLQLLSCRPDANRGDYFCDFRHDYPASMHQSGYGGSEVVVGPAENPGWYLYELVECG